MEMGHCVDQDIMSLAGADVADVGHQRIGRGQSQLLASGGDVIGLDADRRLRWG